MWIRTQSKRNSTGEAMIQYSTIQYDCELEGAQAFFQLESFGGLVAL
jgi:hypothetical protein